jgi:hypothetical protein
MKTQETIRKLTAWASDASARVRKMGDSVWGILNLSLGDDAISWKRTLCVSIERNGVSVAEGSRFLSRIKIGALRQYPAEEGKYATPENVANTVSLAIGEFKAGNAEICLGIPKAWTVFQVVELPASVKETLPDVISYELDRLTPFGPDQAFYDYRVLEEQPEKLRIAVAAVKADLINPYLSALREKGIRVDRILINLTGIAALVCFAGQGEDTVYLDVDENGYEGALVRNRFVSSVLAGRIEDGDEESIMRSALQEIMPFVDQLRNEGKPPLIVVHLRGRLPVRGYSILERLETAPYRVLSDMDLKLDIPGRRDSIPYSALGGVVDSLRPGGAGMNLLSKGRYRESARPIAATAALGVLVLCAGLLFMASPIEIEGKRLEEIDRQISLRKDEAWKAEAVRREIDDIRKEIAAINNFKTGKPMVMDIVKELTAILPKNAWLSRIRITDTGIDIEGYISGSAAELLPTLEASKYLQKVEFSSPTFRDPRMNADRFVITMEMESATDEGGTIASENKK